MQRLLRNFALGDVLKYRGKLARPHLKSIDIIIELLLFDKLLEGGWLAGEGHVAVCFYKLRALDMGIDVRNASALTRQLMDERKKTNALEARIAKTTLRMEALLSDASNENVSRAVETLNAEKAELRRKLNTAVTERDRLMGEVTAYRENTGLEWDTERKDNAILRERINDLAAQVTAMTAAIEGPESPINMILEQAGKTKRTKAVSGSGSNDGQSLADRVRALQETARTKPA